MERGKNVLDDCIFVYYAREHNEGSTMARGGKLIMYTTQDRV